jgi:hypothetical protein
MVIVPFMIPFTYSEHSVFSSFFLCCQVGKMSVVTPLKSRIDRNSDEFKKNYESMNALVAELNEKLSDALGEGKDNTKLKHKQQGKLLGRISSRNYID